jgi:PIN domain nuclease of toxin-antitoxin system
VVIARERLRLPGEREAWIAKSLSSFPLQEATLTHAVALETEKIRLPHRDPADRFIAATARVYDLTLVTADERLLASRAVRTLANC